MARGNADIQSAASPATRPPSPRRFRRPECTESREVAGFEQGVLLSVWAAPTP